MIYEATCDFCGKEFTYTSGRSLRRFCSRHCSGQGAAQMNYRPSQPQKSRPIIDAICDICGKPYQLIDQGTTRNRGRACSKSCAARLSDPRTGHFKVQNWEIHENGTASLQSIYGSIVIDADLVPVVSRVPWWPKKCRHTTYARSKVIQGENQSWVYLHHLVAGYPIGGLVTDHFDHNGLNNRRGNLRTITQLQNSRHRKPKPALAESMGLLLSSPSALAGRGEPQ